MFYLINIIQKKKKQNLFGDSNKDIAAAKKAGIEGILVNWGFSDHKEDALKLFVN